VTAPDTEVTADDADHVGVQLDALAGMVARQGQPLAAEGESTASPESAERAEAEPNAVGPEVDAADALAPEVPSLEAPAPAVEVSDDAGQSGDGTAADSSEEIDPLTAPLAALAGTSGRTVPTLLEPVAEPDAPGADGTSTREDQAGPLDIPAVPAGNVVTAVETQTAGRAAALLRPAQLLIVGAAALNLVLVGFDAVLGTAAGAMTMVLLSLALITLAALAGAVVTFLHWVSRAHTHVTATAASPQRHGASMSLIGWFIPVAGFVIGYRVLQDLWTGSDPTTRGDADATPAKVRLIDVWLLGVVTAALFGYAMPFALGASALWGGLSGIGLLVAALSLASVMGAISSWQLGESTADVGATQAEPEGVSPAADELSETAPAPEPLAVSAE
jgi:hypothetical protein